MFKVCGSKILDTWIDNLKLLASLVSHLLARGIFRQVLNDISFSLVVDISSLIDYQCFAPL